MGCFTSANEMQLPLGWDVSEPSKTVLLQLLGAERKIVFNRSKPAG